MRFFNSVIFALIIASQASMAQGLKIIDTNFNLVSEVGTETSTVIKIKNTSSHIINFGIKKVETNIRSSQFSKFCFNNDCIEKDIALEGEIIKLMSGQVYTGFTVRLETGLVPGNSSIKLKFYNVADINDQVEVEINYSIKDKIKEGILHISDVIELSDVFPNPVKEKAIFNYNYLNPDKEVRIVIHSVLGSIIGEFNLSPYESRLSVPVEDYNPGVYFYTLYIENEGVATKKMVVRK